MSETEGILHYFKDNIILEKELVHCIKKEELTKVYLTSHYFKNMIREMDFNEDVQLKTIGDKQTKTTYELSVDFRINMGLRTGDMSHVPKILSHKHNYYELIYVYRGTYAQEIDGHLLTLQEGEACLLNRDLIHCDLAIKKTDQVLFFCFSEKIYADQVIPFCESHALLKSFLYPKVDATQNIRSLLLFKDSNKQHSHSLVEQILAEYFNDEVGSYYMLLGLLMRLFHRFTMIYDQSQLVTFTQSKMSLLWEDIQHYIEEHLCDVTREQLAEKFHYNANYINTIIKLQTGMTYSEYIAHKRVIMATYLLRNSKLSINQIVRVVGYQNKSYFYRLFVTKYGLTPQEFRQMIQDS